MPKKSKQSYRKRSLGESSCKVRYQEKVVSEWQCGVCSQAYDQTQTYCLNCMQSLYYYCYINNQMFVTNDDSYLDLYYVRPLEELSSCSENSETDSN
jgi:hypothetical protein